MTRVTLIFPLDPLGNKIGGVETFVRGFIRYAPHDLHVSMVGITSSRSERPTRVWQELLMGGRAFSFFPVLYIANENWKSRIPLSARFTLALKTVRLDLRGHVLLFNRFEPAVAFMRSNNPKIGFVHNDKAKQLSADSEQIWRYLGGVYLWLERQLMRRFDKVYTVNMDTLRFYQQRYPEISERISFLPTWVDEQVFLSESEDKRSLRHQLAARHGIPSDARWLLFVGRLQKQKNPLLLVTTFAKVLQHEPAALLLVIGEGNLRVRMEALARELQVREKVFFLGSMPQGQLAAFYYASEVLLLTSTFEGMPRACVEALGCGLPVVTTRVGEVGRLLVNGRGGEIVDLPDPAALALAVVKVLAGEPRYASAVCKEAVAEFKPEGILAEVYQCCRALASRYPAER